MLSAYGPKRTFVATLAIQLRSGLGVRGKGYLPIPGGEYFDPLFITPRWHRLLGRIGKPRGFSVARNSPGNNHGELAHAQHFYRIFRFFSLASLAFVFTGFFNLGHGKFAAHKRSTIAALASVVRMGSSCHLQPTRTLAADVAPIRRAEME
jgi:hypothetical protein